LQSDSLFADRFARPGKVTTRAKVEGLVGYAVKYLELCRIARCPPKGRYQRKFGTAR